MGEAPSRSLKRPIRTLRDVPATPASSSTDQSFAGAAWIGEQTLFGPFDLDDVAFTMGGAFVALAFLPRWAVASRPERTRVILAAVALAGVALAYRYLLGLGKA